LNEQGRCPGGDRPAIGGRELNQQPGVRRVEILAGGEIRHGGEVRLPGAAQDAEHGAAADQTQRASVGARVFAQLEVRARIEVVDQADHAPGRSGGGQGSDGGRGRRRDGLSDDLLGRLGCFRDGSAGETGDAARLEIQSRRRKEGERRLRCAGYQHAVEGAAAVQSIE